MPELRKVYTVVDTRDRILEAALAIFSESGYEGATIRQIALRAEVSQGLIHHHFQDKEGLWRTVAEAISSDYIAHVSPALDPATIDGDTAPRLLAAYLDFWKHRPMALRFWLWRLLNGSAEERRDHDEGSLCVATLQKAQDAGFVRRDIPAWLAMVTAGSLIQYFLHNDIAKMPTRATKQLDEESFLHFVNSLIVAPPPQASAVRARRK